MYQTVFKRCQSNYTAQDGFIALSVRLNIEKYHAGIGYVAIVVALHILGNPFDARRAARLKVPAQGIGGGSRYPTVCRISPHVFFHHASIVSP